jgi:hypothetical protein
VGDAVILAELFQPLVCPATNRRLMKTCSAGEL